MGTQAADELFAKTLNNIMYLASLASNVKEVDPILDSVRDITSRDNTDGQRAAEQLSILQATQRRLEDYLIKSDPVRTFTREELQQKMQEQRLANRFSKLRWIFAGIIVLSLCMFSAAFMLPGTADQAMRGQAGAFLALLTSSAGASWFYITALKNFKVELRSAYKLLCFSSLLLGLAQIQLPIVAFYNLGEAPLFRYGGVAAPTLIAMICAYTAIQTYARAVRLPHSLLTSLKFFLTLQAVLVAVAVFAPHASEPQQEHLFDLSMAIMVANLLTVSFNAAVAAKIAGITSPIYAKAMRLLAAAQTAAAIGLALSIGTLFVLGYLFGPVFTTVAMPFLVSNILWLMASFAFKKASEY